MGGISLLHSNTISTPCTSVHPNCYPDIDCCRILMAFLVITIHFSPLKSMSLAANYFVAQYIARLAVPFFFCCNGFFLYRTIDSEAAFTQSLSRSCIKAFKMYLFWTAVYAPILFYPVFKSIFVRHTFPLKSILSITRNFLFVGSYNHLWYLLALCVALALLWFFRIRLHLHWRQIVLATLLLYLLGTLYDGYAPLLRTCFLLHTPAVYWPVKLYRLVFLETRNGIFFGCPFVVMGVLIAQKRSFRSRTFYCIVLLLSLAFGACEAFLLWQAEDFAPTAGHNMYLFLLPAVYSLFCLLLIKKVQTTDTTARLRKFSGLLFLVHPWPIFIYGVVYRRLFHDVQFFFSSPLGYCIVCAISCVCVLLLLRLLKNPRFARLKQFC